MTQVLPTRCLRPQRRNFPLGSRRRCAPFPGFSRGAAAVECAFCVPLVILLMFGTLSVCSDMYLKQTLTIAAFEGARTGVRRHGNRQGVEAAVQNILDARGVVDAEITIVPEDFTTLNALDEIEVQVAVPAKDNTFYAWGLLGSGREIAAKVVMAREFDE